MFLSVLARNANFGPIGDMKKNSFDSEIPAGLLVGFCEVTCRILRGL